ncbi:MAG: hypothetical protein JKY65_15580 [Planctomycetes bacterium]|nr:hypothetical protein [Planctomycetota bacterium]
MTSSLLPTSDGLVHSPFPIWNGLNHGPAGLIRLACLSPDGRHADLRVVHDCVDWPLAGAGFNLLGDVVSVAHLTEPERDFLAQASRLTRRQQALHLAVTGEDLEARENDLLGGCPRLTAKGYDIDARDDLPREEAMAAVFDLMNRIAAAEAREGVTLRCSFSGGPGRARLHLEWGPAGGIHEPEFCRIMLGRARRMCQEAGVPTCSSGDAPVWVDMVPLNKAANCRGGLFRPLHGLHKNGLNRKTLVWRDHWEATPLTPAILAPDLQAWRAVQASRPERRVRQRTRPRPAPSAALDSANLGPAQQEAVARFAAKYASIWVGSEGSRHFLALALGTYLGLRRVPVEVAVHVVVTLACRARDPEIPDREQAARDGAIAGRHRNQPPGKIIGEVFKGAEHDLCSLADLLTTVRIVLPWRPQPAPLDGIEEPTPKPAPAETFPRAAPSLHDMVQFIEDGLSLDDPRPQPVGVLKTRTGCGKTEAAIRYLVREVVNTPGRCPKTLVVVSSHDFGEEFLARAKALAVKERVALPIAKTPKFECDAGLEDRYRRVAKAGHNPVAVVCRACDRFLNGNTTSCSYHRARHEALAADILVVPMAHLALAGFWDGRFAKNRLRLIVEEDAALFFAPLSEVTAADLSGAEGLLRNARRSAGARLLGRDRVDSGLELTEFFAAYDRLLLQLRAALSTYARHAVTVLLDPADARLLAAKDTLATVEQFVVRAVQVLLESGQPIPRNPLPGIVELARTVVRDQPPVVLRNVWRERESGLTPLYVTMRRPVPSAVRIVILDATADLQLVGAILNRPVEVLEGGPPRPTNVVHVIDGRWSKKALGAPARVKAVAETVNAIVSRFPNASRIGLISYKALVDRSKDDTLVALVPEVEAMHFHGLRGKDALKGVDLLVVVGTPRPPDFAVRHRALLLGAGSEELEQEPELRWVERDGCKIKSLVYLSPILERARESLVGAELVQAIGRGPRGNELDVPVFVLSTAPFEFPDTIRRVSQKAACLDWLGRKWWAKAFPLVVAGLGHVRLKGELGISERLARRLVAEIPHYVARPADGATVDESVSGPPPESLSPESLRPGGGATEEYSGFHPIPRSGTDDPLQVPRATGVEPGCRRDGLLYRYREESVPDLSAVPTRGQLCDRLRELGMTRSSAAMVFDRPEGTLKNYLAGSRPCPAWLPPFALHLLQGVRPGRWHAYRVLLRDGRQVLAFDPCPFSEVNFRLLVSVASGRPLHFAGGAQGVGAFVGRFGGDEPDGVIAVRRATEEEVQGCLGLGPAGPDLTTPLDLARWHQGLPRYPNPRRPRSRRRTQRLARTDRIQRRERRARRAEGEGTRGRSRRVERPEDGRRRRDVGRRDAQVQTTLAGLVYRRRQPRPPNVPLARLTLAGLKDSANRPSS